MADIEIQYFSLPSFTFQDGTTLQNAKLAYRELNAQASKVAVIPTCFRGRIGATLTLSDAALQDYRIIVVALFGNGESSSPSNTPGFPATIDYRDCVHAQYRLLTEHLGVKSVDVMMGFSMGGQCTYHWASLYPDFVQSAVIICSSARTSRHNHQFLEGPKTALQNSADYGSEAHRSGTARPLLGLRAFGKAYSAWLTSAEWFEQERYKDQGYASLEDWDKHVADINYHTWEPDDLLAKLSMWQRGDITKCYPGEGLTLQEALGRIKARVLLMPCRTDQYFRWEASEREVAQLKSGTLEVIPSIWGHVAGGGSNSEDIKWISTTVAKFLESGKAPV